MLFFLLMIADEKCMWESVLSERVVLPRSDILLKGRVYNLVAFHM